MNIVETFREFFVESGAAWVLWLLLLLAVGTVAVAIERFLYFRTKSDNLEGLAATLDAHLSTGDHHEALTVLAPSRSVGASVASAGLRLADRGPQAAAKAMESVIAIERKSLEKWLVYLGTLGNNAPFIGLFGTVIGVVVAFHALGEANALAGTASSQIASSQVMGAIAEALVATAIGIGVALPAVVLYNYFQRRIATLMSDAEALSNLVVAYLVDERGPSATLSESAESTSSGSSARAAERSATGIKAIEGPAKGESRPSGYSVANASTARDAKRK